MKPTFRQRVAQEMSRGRSFYGAIFSSSWNSLGSFINTYDAVDPRNQAMRGVIARPASAADLVTSQPYIRNLVRNFERNNPTVRAAVEGLVATVVGHGIWLEPDSGDDATDELIRPIWEDYCRDCFIDGINIFEGQNLAFRDVTTAGEAIWRFVIDDERRRRGRIPVAILPLESEWLGDSGNTVVGQDGTFVGGIELDDYSRAVAYMLNSPSGRTERVAARFVSHIFERRRSLQIRGEPWFSPIITTLKQEKDLVVTELEAAKNSAGYAVAITTNTPLPPDYDEKGSMSRDITIGSVTELMPNEGIEVIKSERPSQQIAPFRDMLRGDTAGAMRLSRRWLDRDISAGTYSAQRGDGIDQDRLTGPIQQWFGNQTIGRVYRFVLPYICAQLGIAPVSDRYRLLPDGQPYIDPQKDADASATAIAMGLSDYEEEAGRRGSDYRKTWRKLVKQRAEAKEMGLELGTPSSVSSPATTVDESASPKAEDKRAGRAAAAAARSVRSRSLPPTSPGAGEVRNTIVTDVPYIAGVTDDGQTLMVDRRVPQFWAINGKNVNVWKALEIHEKEEYFAMEALGLDYHQAHQNATMREHAYLSKFSGLSAQEIQIYERRMLDLLAEIEATGIGQPPGIYLGPYRAGDAGDDALCRCGRKSTATTMPPQPA
ncbi:MAG: phage portal protein [Xanthomonadaceae bacterium]|nr:phage portal protein [Xanthomonadaceae bacterium]